MLGRVQSQVNAPPGTRPNVFPNSIKLSRNPTTARVQRFDFFEQRLQNIPQLGAQGSGQLPAHLLRATLELLVVEFGTTAYAGFRNLCKPFRTVARCIHLLAGTRNPPASVNRLQPT